MLTTEALVRHLIQPVTAKTILDNLLRGRGALYDERGCGIAGKLGLLSEGSSRDRLKLFPFFELFLRIFGHHNIARGNRPDQFRRFINYHADQPDCRGLARSGP
jgi:hypothetical protein